MLNRLNKLIYPGGKPNARYLNYVGWSFVSTVCVSVQMTMSTHSMLDAVGSSDDRTGNYIGKDILGQLGGLMYMSKMAEHVDREPSKFILFSGLVQQTSIILMSSTPLFEPHYFLPVAGLSNAMSNVSFTGYGAINAKCVQEMSDNNIGEMYAKITVINTMASSIGMALGVVVCMYIPDHAVRTSLLPIIGACRIYSYNKAVEGLI